MFSCTAPVITEADEQAERAALTKAESLAIESDLYGYTETPTQERFNLPNLQASLAEMQECLQAISRKDDYQQALQHNLVERESNPIRFLRSEEFHPAAAARRIVEYWKLRKKAFGADAYLPLTLDAALEPQVEFLRRGAVRWLPNDEKGRLVLFMDRVRCFDLGMSRNDILRCVFYLLHCGQERGEDFVLVCNLKRLELYKHFDRMFAKGAIMLLRNGPMQWKASHVCSGSRRSVVSIVMPIYKHLAGKQHRLRAVLHMGNDDAEIVASFAQYGILPENLSDTIGGLLCDDDFTLWVDERQRIEWSRGASAHDAGNA